MRYLLCALLIATASVSRSHSARAATSDVCADRNADANAKIGACSSVLKDSADIVVLANARHQRGLSYFRKKQLDEAIADYNEALKLNPAFVLALGARALAFQSKGDFDRALADLNEAVKRDPSSDVRLIRGYFYRDRKEWDKAEFDFQKPYALDQTT